MNWQSKLPHSKCLENQQNSEAREAYQTKSKDIETSINALSESRERMKSTLLLNQITGIWREEAISLRARERDTITSLHDPSFRWILMDSDVSKVLSDIEQRDREFEDVALRPIWTMREDLKNWMGCLKDKYDTPSSGSVKNLVDRMKMSVEEVRKALFAERSELETEIHKSGYSFEYNDNPVLSEVKEMGVPEAAWSWTTPDEGFLVTLLAEFLKLDISFFSRLESVQSEYASLHESHAELTKEELEISDYFWNMFQRLGGTNRRKLALEFLSKILPNRNKGELDEIVRLCERDKMLRARALTLKRSWMAARSDLSTRIKSTLVRALQLTEEKKAKAEEEDCQHRICKHLQEQVKRWREQKAEIAELEEKERMMDLIVKKRLQHEKKSREEAKRQATKQKVAAYKATKEALKNLEEENELVRLAALREMHAKQAKLDAARLLEAEKSRLLKIQLDHQHAKEAAVALERERQQRLEAFRRKVRPEVGTDRERLMSDTLSWRVRQNELHGNSKDTNQHAEDNARNEARMNSFSDEHLHADRRTRLTSMLHSAGLLDSGYARALLATVPSSFPTRKDNLTSEEMQAIFNNS
ncbi:unnamed protein product [Calicophoron daubneyi]|uniref:Coiled-coil domain-containing protein 148 n=1 Tax=Calicophoron daubneyi TaxID=300641 RepID=A0AAV2U220_CALDB